MGVMERYVIHVTKACNCDCVYCYEKDKTSEYTWDEVKKLIDDIVQYNNKKTFSIEFLGGEPLLRFDLIQKSYEYLESNPTVNVPEYCITSNGTILDFGIIQFLIDNPKVHIGMSMDGTPHMNQLRVFKDSRKNTHDSVISNFKELTNHINTNRVSIHMVTHPYNVGFLKDGIVHLYNKGVRRIGVGTVESTIELTEEYKHRFKQELYHVSDLIHSGQLEGINIDLFEWLKPKSDKRNYVRDKSGKVIAESYGRSDNDITKTNVYASYEATSPLGDTIYYLREAVYKYHNK